MQIEVGQLYRLWDNSYLLIDIVTLNRVGYMQFHSLEEYLTYLLVKGVDNDEDGYMLRKNSFTMRYSSAELVDQNKLLG